jgi:nucleotide-binding universal stress UspA family protein
MYKHILIPTDGSALSEQAVRQGIGLAKALGAEVTGISVSPSFHTFAVEPVMLTDTPAQYRRDCEARSEKYLGVIRDTAEAAGVRYHGMHVINDHPYDAIIQAANEQGCDLIFMASHGRKGVSALVVGSETTKVLTHSKIPTLVCR